jgi:hypothetical protein
MTQQTDLLADLRQAKDESSLRRTCKACAALDSVSGDTKTELIAALDGTIGGERLARILQSNGYDVSYRQIRKHRDGGHTS